MWARDVGSKKDECVVQRDGLMRRLLSSALFYEDKRSEYECVCFFNLCACLRKKVHTCVNC